MVVFVKRFVILAGLALLAGVIAFVVYHDHATTGPTSRSPLINTITNSTTTKSIPAGAPDANSAPDFVTEISPLLSRHCIKCHGSREVEAGLRLDSYQEMVTGGDSGPAVVPGKPSSSLLITAVSYHDSDLQMPPNKKLPQEKIDLLQKWVAAGAPHPDADQVEYPALESQIDYEAGREHWAFQAPVKPEIPSVQEQTWVEKPIDAFVLQKLKEQRLEHVGPADKLTLIRRATFDLTGLPPTPEEVEHFLKDESPVAYARLIDRLLDSPQYGERWGRFWLDVARYADSNGRDENVAHAKAWQYRDYVIDAFNRDKPYDQFLREQIAGDLLEPADNYQETNQQLIATAFLAIGPKSLAENDEMKMEMDIIDEQVTTISSSFMGLTMGCARCHDHKFDPVSHQDYYALAGILKSTKTMEHFKRVAMWQENALYDPEYERLKKISDQKISELKQKIEEFKKQPLADLKVRLAESEKKFGIKKKFPTNPENFFLLHEREELKKLTDQLEKLEQDAPVEPTTMGVIEGEPQNLPVHLRGNHLTLGQVVSRGFPQVLALPDQSEIPDTVSGRRELADWLTRDDHPLTARVFVNRLWRWHFGTALVGTPNNFGLMGEAPSNQELLDWLAVEFIESGYSIKQMHRLIMLSNTYQLSGEYRADNFEIDPENKFHWRYSGRRLEAEAIRDATLAVSGLLDREFGGNLLDVENHENVVEWDSTLNFEYYSNRRSVYMPVVRNHLHPAFQLFDYCEASLSNGNRDTSTVATQALYLMNSSFMEECAASLSDDLLAREADDQKRIETLYRKCFGRLPNEAELGFALEFLEQFTPEEEVSSEERHQQAWRMFCQAILASNEFTYIN